jgi:aquaporin Z
MNKYIAELVGTFFLVFIGVSSAAFTAAVPGIGIGLLGVSLAFGLTLTAMAYVLGPISGCHLNPAVSVGLCVAGRLPRHDLIQYVIAQIIGGALGAAAVYEIAKGGGVLDAFIAGGFASNGFAEHSPGNFDMHSVMLAEGLATLMFVFVILGVTHDNTPKGFAPIGIGLALVIAHLATIHVSNASINPARSLATAVFAKGWALDQLWVFWVAPIVGGILGGLLFKKIGCENCA